MSRCEIIQGDALASLRALPAESVQTCVTSPPYWQLRDYQVEGQLGREKTPQEFVAALVGALEEVRRVLRPDGTLWLNLGDTYAGKPRGGPGKAGDRRGAHREDSALKASSKTGGGLQDKQLVGIPWRVALALGDAGWLLRQDIIWAKPNPMPEGVTDRCVRSHEHLFLLSKGPRYLFNHKAIREPARKGWGTRTDTTDYQAPGGRVQTGLRKNRTPKHDNGHYTSNLSAAARDVPDERNARDVWTIAPAQSSEDHFAVMPAELARRCIFAGSRPGDTVLDPFAGTGTVPLLAESYGRDAVAIELNPKHVELMRLKLAAQTAQARLFGGVA